ncbi:MAG TPA: septum site-determining protein Ssd [Jatrophihabitans sp.]|jgi:secretion/DNA translocation related CpaE-like protein|uniref:septum site-determining protein Ssd n=1 Tax=Jatrophihabitans sp. TaxID=1932789 RepID=UPI002EF728EE
MTAQPIIGVLAGCGGAGASVFAAVLAGCAAAQSGQAFLIDCDPVGGGVDVLLGCERAAGSRWSQVRLRGGRLDPAVLRDCLPSWHQVSVLAVDAPAALDPAALGPITAAAAVAGPVVLDIARWPSPIRAAALSCCDLTILITPAQVRAVTAAAAIAADLERERTALVIRGSAPTLPAGRIGELLGLPVLGELGHDRASRQPGGLNPRRIRRSARRVAEAVLSQAAVVAGPASEAAFDPPAAGAAETVAAT